MATWHTVGTKSVGVSVYPRQPVKSWSISVDKTSVFQGDTVTITASVNWEAPGGVQFKLKVSAFGKTYESNAVSASTSPTIIKMPITVPTGVSGKQTISVTLLAYY